jgi:hypothetical protein
VAFVQELVNQPVALFARDFCWCVNASTSACFQMLHLLQVILHIVGVTRFVDFSHIALIQRWILLQDARLYLPGDDYSVRLLGQFSCSNPRKYRANGRVWQSRVSRNFFWRASMAGS